MGVFLLSLDCEGLWGMADSELAMSGDAINPATLAEAYSFIYRTLDETGVRATAAFVSAFASERQALQASLPDLEILAGLQPEWFRLLMPRLRSGEAAAMNGLEGHQYWRQLAAAGHEMAWHGSTHMPMSDTTPADAVKIELALAQRLGEALGHIPRTVVFPRNQIGHLDRLKAAGFWTYRDSRGHGLMPRVSGLAREWAACDKGDAALSRLDNGWRISPAGYFLNWPSGVRGAVPISVTIRRWRSMLRCAAERGRCVHMWFHPHNLITAPAMRTAFSLIMAEVGTLVRAGNLKSLTLADANVHYGLE